MRNETASKALSNKIAIASTLVSQADECPQNSFFLVCIFNNISPQT